MGKHSKPPTSEQADKYVKQLENNPQSMARWLLLLSAVSTIDKHEQKLGIENDSDDLRDGDGNEINKYIDEYEKDVIGMLQST